MISADQMDLPALSNSGQAQSADIRHLYQKVESTRVMDIRHRTKCIARTEYGKVLQGSLDAFETASIAAQKGFETSSSPSALFSLGRTLV